MADAATLERVGPVVTAYRDKVAAVRARVDAYVARTWGRLGDYRESDITRFVAAVVPVVTGGQRQVAALTDAYLAQIETAVLGEAARPVGVPASVFSVDAVRGVPAVAVYRRPGVAVWTSLARGAVFADAVAAGRARARELAATDLQLAKTHASRFVLDGKEHVVGFRRVLEGGRACALCADAAAKTYRSGELMPIHPHCDCGVEPIYAAADPGPIPVDEPLTDEDVAVSVHEHGEIGPVLAVRGQTFTGPDDI